jgi:CelD/BcsL family acetyltransferase involved in cellulose biosynthesis
MTLQLLDIRNSRLEIESVWKQLSENGAPSYFLSWAWIGNWIDSLPANVVLNLAVFREHGEAVMACFLGRSVVVRQRIFRSDAYLLNQTGNRVFDQVYIEYNGFLSKPGFPVNLREMADLLPGKWEEIYLSGLDPDGQPANCLQQEAGPYHFMIANRLPSPYVDLERVRQNGDYAALMGKNTRSQIRRSYQLYRQRGVVACEIAADPQAAESIFDELVDLHQRSWQARGKKGAFASEWFRVFHRRLIQDRLASGEIQLIRVRCGTETIGCLYSFIYRGRVYFYQSGLCYETDNRLKPGLICHAEAIQHNARMGASEYDFLAGFDVYKERLATDSRTLVWARIQKPRLKFRIESLARGVALHAMERYRAKRNGPQGRLLPLAQRSRGVA